MKNTEEKTMTISWMSDGKTALVESAENVPSIKKGDLLKFSVLMDLMTREGVKVVESRNEKAEGFFRAYSLANPSIPKKLIDGIIFAILEPTESMLAAMQALNIKTESELIETAVKSLVDRAVLNGLIDHDKEKGWFVKTKKDTERGPKSTMEAASWIGPIN